MSAAARGQTQWVRHMVDPETLGILACPLCGGRLRNADGGLSCPVDGAAFPMHPSGLLDLRPPDGRAAADLFAAQYRAGRLADGWQPLSAEAACRLARRRSARIHAALLDSAPRKLGGAGHVTQGAWDGPVGDRRSRRRLPLAQPPAGIAGARRPGGRSEPRYRLRAGCRSALSDRGAVGRSGGRVLAARRFPARSG